MNWYGLLPRILNMSMTASIIILSVLICRFILRKAPKKYSYILWSVVLFRLLCPFSLSAPISLLGIFNTPIVTEVVLLDIDETVAQKEVNITSYVEYIPLNIVHTENPAITLPISGTDGTISQIVNDSLPKGEEQTVADPLEVFISLATYLWILGVIVMVGKGCLSYSILYRKLIGSLHYKSNIYIADYISTPFVLGVINPKIYLPSGIEEKEYKYIIQHEKCHIRRGDTVYKILAYLALCIHWFNPLVWLAFYLFVKDMEMSCDEAVIKKLGASIRADYASSILEFASGQKILFGAPLAFGEGEPAGRIKNLSMWKKPTIIVSVTAAVICCCIVIIGIFNPLQENKNNQSEEKEITTENNVNESIEKENEEIVNEVVREIPSKEEVLSMREKVLEGMSDDEISRLRENIKVANLAMERAYLEDNLFTKLSDKDSPYWLYFDQEGDIQLGWWYKQQILSKEAIMKIEDISEEEFAERFTEPGIVYNRFDADNFIALISDMQASVQNRELVSDLQQLIDLTYLAKETHEMEYANAIYKILHDMDYFLLRYGIEDVGKYTSDPDTVSEYYGVLIVYGANADKTSKKHSDEFYEMVKECRYGSAMDFMSMYLKMIKERDATGIAILSDKDYSEKDQVIINSNENEWMSYATAEFYEEKKTGEFTMKIMSRDGAIVRFVDVLVKKEEGSGRTYYAANGIREV